MTPNPPAFWSIPVDELLRQLEATPGGLTSEQARQRLARFGANLLKPQKRTTTFALLLTQFTSPIILILLCAAALSYFLGDAADSIIILIIVFASGMLGFWQERGAADAVAKLLAIVKIKAMVLRDGSEKETPSKRSSPAMS